MQPSSARTPSLSPATHRPSPQFEPVPFRARPCIAPGTEITRPVALRSRNPSFCTTGVCPACPGCSTTACRATRSWSLGEMRVPHRVVSFGSAVTPQSASTDGEDVVRTSNSWDWSGDEEERAHVLVKRRGMMRVRASRSNSSSSSVDYNGLSMLDRVERSFRGGGRYRPAPVSAPRTQSALVDGCCATPRADGPRPWDMTELSHNSKNFASFGFRKNHEGGMSFADTFSSRHLLRHSIKGGGRNSTHEWKGDGSHRQGKRRFRFLRKLSARLGGSG